MALTTDNIVDTLVERFGLRRREALDFVDTFFADIKGCVEQGQRVKIAGFGALQAKPMKYVPKRRDLEPDPEKAWKVINFTPSQTLKQRVQRALIEEGRDKD